MNEAATRKRLRIVDYGNGKPYFGLPVYQVPEVRKLLDEHRVAYEASELSFSIDGAPETTIIILARDADVPAIQSILDCVA